MMRTMISDFELALQRVDRMLLENHSSKGSSWKDLSTKELAKHLMWHSVKASEQTTIFQGVLDSTKNPTFNHSFLNETEENLASCATRALMLLTAFIKQRQEHEKLPRPLS